MIDLSQSLGLHHGSDLREGSTLQVGGYRCVAGVDRGSIACKVIRANRSSPGPRAVCTSACRHNRPRQSCSRSARFVWPCGRPRESRDTAQTHPVIISYRDCNHVRDRSLIRSLQKAAPDPFCLCLARGMSTKFRPYHQQQLSRRHGMW